MYKIPIDLKPELLKHLAEARNIIKSMDRAALKAAQTISSATRKTKQLVKATYNQAQSMANAYKSAIKASSQYYQNLQKIKNATKDIATAKIQSLLTSGTDLGNTRTANLFRKLGSRASRNVIYPNVLNIQKRIQAGKLISATELYKLGNKSGVKFSAGMLDAINKEAKLNRMNLAKMVSLEKSTGKKIYSTIEANVAAGFKGGTRKAETYMIRRLKSIVSFIGIYGVARIAKGAIASRIETEQAQRTIAAILPNLGVKGDIKERLKFAKGEMVRFQREMLGMGIDPFSIQRPYMQFLAASKGSIDVATREFSAFMLLAKVYQLNTEGIKGMTYALTQMKSKGKLSMEELSRQMGNQLPGAVQMFADAMGYSYDEMLKIIKTTGIKSEIAITAVTRYAEDKFGSLGNFLTSDFGSVLNELTGNFKNLFATIVSGSSGVMIKSLAFSFSKILMIAKEFSPILNAVSFYLIAIALASKKALIMKGLFNVGTFSELRKTKGSFMTMAFGISLAVGSLEMFYSKLKEIRMLRQRTGGKKLSIMRDIFPLVASGAIFIATVTQALSPVFGLLANVITKYGVYAKILETINKLLKTQIVLKALALATSPWGAAALGAAAIGTVGYLGWRAGDAKITRTEEQNKSSKLIESELRNRLRFQPLDINMNLTGSNNQHPTVTIGKNKDVGNFNFNNLLGNQL